MIIACLIMSAGCKKPEEVLANHMSELTEVVEDASSPASAIEDGRKYLRDNLPEIAKASAEIAVELDEIEKRSERKDRLEEVLETIEKPATRLVKALARVAEKAGDDKDAKKAGKAFQKQWQGIAEQLMAEALGKEMDKAKVELTRVIVSNVKMSVSTYQLTQNALPDSLDDLVEKKFIKERSLRDGWGLPVKLEREDGDKFRVCSVGPDDVLGTEDDVCSDWNQ